MLSVYLAYAPLDEERPPHDHLMVRQLIAAAARAVLSQPRGDDAGPLHSRLLVSAHPAVLAVTAAVAADYAAFAEPEGEERHLAPLVATLDGTEAKATFELPDSSPEYDAWMHPARTEAPLPLREAMSRHDPSVIIIAGNPRGFVETTMGSIEGWLRERKPRMIYFRRFFTGPSDFFPDTGAEVVDAEAIVAERFAAIPEETIAPFDAALAEGEEIDLEPFFPFGTAIEHAIWGQGRD